MKNLKFKNTALLLMTSCILVGCQSNNQNKNIYENKLIISTESEDDINTEITTEIASETEIIIENTQIEETTTEEKITDEEVIEYINKVGAEINNCTDGITESAKQGFITIVDFIFYDGKIGGRTFDSLKDSTKEKVVEIYSKISSYVEENWPTWKQYITNEYNNIKELWDDNKDEIKEGLENQKQKVKNWYEKFRAENQR